MKNVIEDRNNEIESLKKTIELLQNADKVNRLNIVLKTENEYLIRINKLCKKEYDELSKWKEDHLDVNEKLV